MPPRDCKSCAKNMRPHIRISKSYENCGKFTEETVEVTFQDSCTSTTDLTGVIYELLENLSDHCQNCQVYRPKVEGKCKTAQSECEQSDEDGNSMDSLCNYMASNMCQTKNCEICGHALGVYVKDTSDYCNICQSALEKRCPRCETKVEEEKPVLKKQCPLCQETICPNCHDQIANNIDTRKCNENHNNSIVSDNLNLHQNRHKNSSQHNSISHHNNAHHDDNHNNNHNHLNTKSSQRKSSQNVEINELRDVSVQKSGRNNPEMITEVLKANCLICGEERVIKYSRPATNLVAEQDERNEETKQCSRCGTKIK